MPEEFPTEETFFFPTRTPSDSDDGNFTIYCSGIFYYPCNLISSCWNPADQTTVNCLGNGTEYNPNACHVCWRKKVFFSHINKCRVLLPQRPRFEPK